MKELKLLVRPNIQQIAGKAQRTEEATAGVEKAVRLHLGESPFNAPLNRRPSAEGVDELATLLAREAKTEPASVVPFVGGNVAFDAIVRTFCVPQRDNLILLQPTVGDYSRVAAVNDVECRSCLADAQFDLDADAVINACNGRTKAIVLSSPNFPTGRLMTRQRVLDLADVFDGIVVVDETFIDFSRSEGLVNEIAAHPNLVIIRSMSAGYAAAGLCLDYVVASPDVAAVLRGVSSTFALPAPVVSAACDCISAHRFDVLNWVKRVLEEREKVMSAVAQLPMCRKVFRSDANFFMVSVDNAAEVLNSLTASGILVHDCRGYAMCADCLSLTIGSTQENNALLSALRKLPY